MGTWKVHDSKGGVLCFQHDRFIATCDCFLHGGLVLKGWRLTVRVSVGSPCNNREKSAQRDFWPPKHDGVDVVVAHWGLCLPAKQVVLENGLQNSLEMLCLHRKLQLIKSAFRCLRGNDSKDVTMGYIGYYLTHSVAVQCGELCVLDVCRCMSFWHKCETILKQLQCLFPSSSTLFVSNCCLTWQTSPFKGTDAAVVEQLMICFSGLEWKKKRKKKRERCYEQRDLSLRKNTGTQKADRERCCCHSYYT